MPGQTTPSITQIRSVETRDLLRGLLTKHADANTATTFSNLLDNANADDLPIVDTILRNSPLFSHLRLPEEFPVEQLPFFETECLPVVPRPLLRPQYIVHRANISASRIADSLSSLSLISQAIFLGYDTEVLESFDLTTGAYGHSLALARKMAFVLGHYEKDTESWRLAARTFASYGVNARNFGMMAVADSIGAEFSYLDVKSSFDSFSDHRARSSASRKLSYLSFRPITFSEDEVMDGVSASYSFSLTDAVLYVLSHRELGVISQTLLFDEKIEQVWKSLQPAREGFDQFFNDENPYADLRAFRAAPAFIEYEAFRNFRAATQRLYDNPAQRAKDLNGSCKFETEFYSSVKSVRDLLPSQSEVYDALPGSFDRVTAGDFSRSCGLVKAGERDPEFSTLTREEMGKLMAHTMEVDRLLPTTVLRSAAKSATDKFVELILYTLLRAHSPSTKDNFQFKLCFQRYVVSHHTGDITSFVNSIYNSEPRIVAYYMDLLDETMLSQMPLLVKTAEDVYEFRAVLLEWYADQTNDSAVRARAKQLRIDRKIAAVRGQINETRLNIDSVRFRQWIDSWKLAEFSGLIRQESVIAPAGLDLRVKKGVTELRLTAHRDPNARAAVAVMDCYREFCSNPDFGVASYLGRRIRHGTLRGTLLDGLPKPEEYELGAAYKASYEKWLVSFRSSIDKILAKLHFAGKGSASSAVISAEVDSKEKWDLVFNCLRTLHERSQVDHGAGTIPLSVEQYCWYIFELELADVQKAILESRNEFGIFKLKQPYLDAGATGFEKAVNLALSSRFNTVASWFRKPPNISPIAELGHIVEVVLREARGEYPQFNPKLVLSDSALQLSGAVYYHVYDALTVIVRNVGKHGAYPGKLVITAEVEERDLGRALRLDIASLVRSDDSAPKAVARMQEAEKEGPVNADVVEGLSGMRKLQKMKLDKTVLDVKLQADAAESRQVCVTTWFALTGLV